MPSKALDVDYDADVPTIQDIYRNHHGWLTGWLQRKLNCPHDAADLSHDTFLRLLRGESPHGLRQPRAYLLVIANRLLINRYRRRRVEAEALRQVAALLETSDRRGPAEVASAQDLLARVILLLTEELPEHQRRAFVMARVDGMSYRAIAEALGVSQSSVKQYLAKVLAHCHRRLFDELEHR